MLAGGACPRPPRPGARPRLRVAVHAAHRAAHPRGRRLLRNPPVQPPARRHSAGSPPARPRPLGWARQRLRRGRAARRGAEALRAWACRSSGSATASSSSRTCWAARVERASGGEYGPASAAASRASRRTAAAGGYGPAWRGPVRRGASRFRLQPRLQPAVRGLHAEQGVLARRAKVQIDHHHPPAQSRRSTPPGWRRRRSCRCPGSAAPTAITVRHQPGRPAAGATAPVDSTRTRRRVGRRRTTGAPPSRAGAWRSDISRLSPWLISRRMRPAAKALAQ